MKVKDIALIFSCVNQELDVYIQEREAHGYEHCIVLADDTEDVLTVNPETGDMYTNGMLGMMIAMAGSAQKGEEDKHTEVNIDQSN